MRGGERERERHRKWRKRKRRDQEAAVACGCCCLFESKLYRVLSCGCSGVECYTIMYHSMVAVTDYVWLNDVRSNLCCHLLFVYLILLLIVYWGPFERNGGSIWRGGEYWRCHGRRVTKHRSLSLSPVRSSRAGLGCSIKNWRTGEGQEAVITRNASILQIHIGTHILEAKQIPPCSYFNVYTSSNSRVY